MPEGLPGRGQPAPKSDKFLAGWIVLRLSHLGGTAGAALHAALQCADRECGEGTASKEAAGVWLGETGEVEEGRVLREGGGFPD